MLSRRLRTAADDSADEGAVAVLVAILTIVLFAAAAVAVDLGQAFQRRRATQTTADLAALAGAQDLPNAQQACRLAVRYLLDNPPDGDGFSVTESMCTPGGDTPDGTIDVDATKTRIRVDVPRREISFGFAGALGFSSTTVGAQATAEIRTPLIAAIPFFLAADSSSGAMCLKDTSPGGGSPSVMRAALLAAPPVATPTITSITPSPFRGPAGTVVTLTGTNLDVFVRLQFGGVDAVFAVSPNGKTLTATVPAGTGSVTVIGYTQANLGGTAYSMPDPFVYGATAPSPSASASATPSPSPTLPPVGDDCAGDNGEFGYLDIPRAGVPIGKQIEYNTINGVDHPLATYPAALLPAPGIKCANSSGNANLDGAIPDKGTGVPYANCLLTQTGNSLPNATRGFLDGIDALDGRLEGRDPTATVATRGDINVDTFASFLRGGATLADFSSALSVESLPVGSLDRSILASPRFAIAPVLNVSSAGTNNGYYPVVGLQGVFVDSTPSAPTHGFDTSGGGSVTAIHAFAFPLRLLPGLLSTSEVDGTTTFIGTGPVVPVLVE